MEERYGDIYLMLKLNHRSFGVFIFNEEHGIVNEQDEFGFWG